MQECERFNKLLKRMLLTLIELQKAIKGLVVMSAELESMYNNLLNNQVWKTSHLNPITGLVI